MFNPLGNFSTNAPANPAALEAAKNLLGALPECPQGSFGHIYLHWSVGHWNQDFTDYNVCVRYDGSHFSLDVTHDPRDNARGVNNNAPAPHTYMRNTGGFGISVDAMVGASVHNFGSEPVTLGFLEHLSAAAGAVAVKYGIDLSTKTVATPYANEWPILTHAEAAMTVGDPPQYADYGITGDMERWDLASFVAVPDGVQLTAAMAQTCGDALRYRARTYKVALLNS